MDKSSKIKKNKTFFRWLFGANGHHLTQNEICLQNASFENHLNWHHSVTYIYRENDEVSFV